MFRKVELMTIQEYVGCERDGAIGALNSLHHRLSREIESRIERLKDEANTLINRMQRLVENLDRDGANASINSSGEVQGKGSDVDILCGELTTLRAQLQEVLSMKEAALLEREGFASLTVNCLFERTGSGACNVEAVYGGERGHIKTLTINQQKGKEKRYAMIFAVPGRADARLDLRASDNIRVRGV